MTTPTPTPTKLDTFTRAYIEAALWSSTGAPFGECASCGKDKLLCQFAKDDPDASEGDGTEWTLCADCGGDATGNSCEPPLDKNYTTADLAPETLARMVADCDKFQTEQADLLTEENCLSPASDGSGVDGRAGHDFWLTRNGHGCGFWDGDWSEPAAAKLTDAAKACGEVNLYVGDDGRIYC